MCYLLLVIEFAFDQSERAYHGVRDMSIQNRSFFALKSEGEMPLCLLNTL